jgi:hypothetical protein
VKFVDWLDNPYGQGIYWIHGKAGSGKSTLMKFLADHDETRTRLKPWSRGKSLVIAKFFFWHAGTSLQKSQEGLLRSLIFEILRQSPKLATQTYDKWVEIKGVENDDWEWTCDDLLAICQHLAKEITSTKFCFFIDGLDEYSQEQMSPGDLIKTLKQLSVSPNIKLCVSSRPWSEFEEAFGDNPDLLLKLEDLTRSDIHRYIFDKFNENRAFCRFKDADPSYLELIEEVSRPAQGVFLWVYLVVRDLLEGLTHGDTMTTLRQRLRAFPQDLESYFQQMVDSIPEAYLVHTARVFEIATFVERPLSAVAYSFVGDVESDGTFALRHTAEPMKEAEVLLRVEQTRRQLDARCKGLLEVADIGKSSHIYFQFTIDFLHRTVYDFIMQSNIVSSVLLRSPSRSTDRCSTPLVLCRTFLASYPRIVSSVSPDDDGMDREFQEFLRYAVIAEANAKEKHEVLDLVRATARLLKRGRGLCLDDQRFLRLACRSGPLSYVEETLKDSIHIKRVTEPSGPLLDYALWNGIAGVPSDDRIIKAILAWGGDPNQQYRDSTIWGRFISKLSRDRELADQDGFLNIVKLLVKNAASLEDRLPPPIGVIVSDLLADTFGEERYTEILNERPWSSVIWEGWRKQVNRIMKPMQAKETSRIEEENEHTRVDIKGEHDDNVAVSPDDP